MECVVPFPVSSSFILHFLQLFYSPPSFLFDLFPLPLVSLLLPLNYLLSFPSLFPFPLHSSHCFPFNFFHLFIPQTKYILCFAELGGGLCWKSPYQDALVTWEWKLIRPNCSYRQTEEERVVQSPFINSLKATQVCMYVCICHMGWCWGGESWVWLDHSPDMFVLFHLRHLERGPPESSCYSKLA